MQRSTLPARTRPRLRARKKPGPRPASRRSPAEVLDALGLPPFRRKAWPRRGGCDLVSDVTGLTAEWFWPGQTRQIPMPRGGFRRLVRCPWCERWVLRLYGVDALGPGGGPWRCRHCAHLKYPSQYSGRRPGVSRARLEALVASIQRARRPEVAQRRSARLTAELTRLWQREYRWLVRFTRGRWLDQWQDQERALEVSPDR